MEFDIKKVFSAVNAKELKKGDKVICADDLAMLKDLVEQDREGGTIANILDRNAFRFMTNTGEIAAFAYLVERAAENWRPYKDVNELISAWQKKTGVTARPNTMPLIWVKYNNTPYETAQIMAFDNKNEAICVIDTWYDLTELFDKFTYLDGTPCGIKE